MSGCAECRNQFQESIPRINSKPRISLPTPLLSCKTLCCPKNETRLRSKLSKPYMIEMDLCWERLPMDLVFDILGTTKHGKLRRGDCQTPAVFIFRLSQERLRAIESKLTFSVQTVRHPSTPQNRIVLVISPTRYIEIRRSEIECEISLWEDPFEYRVRKTSNDTWRLSECPTRTLLFCDQANGVPLATMFVSTTNRQINGRASGHKSGHK